MKGSKTWPTVPMHQIHSAIIHRVERVPEKMLQGDGLITNVPGICSPYGPPIVFLCSSLTGRSVLSVRSTRVGAARWRELWRRAWRDAASIESEPQIWSPRSGLVFTPAATR